MTDFTKQPPSSGDPNQQFGAPPQGGPGGYPSAPPPPANYGAPAGSNFDPKSGLTLPAGVELASHGRRIGAYFLAIPLWIVTLVIGYLIWGAILWGKGTSPALKVLKMKCINPNDGQVVGWGRMALRDIVGGFVEGLFILPIVGFIMFLAGAKRQSLHDVIGSTVVVYDPNDVLGPR